MFENASLTFYLHDLNVEYNVCLFNIVSDYITIKYSSFDLPETKGVRCCLLFCSRHEGHFFFRSQETFDIIRCSTEINSCLKKKKTHKKEKKTKENIKFN